MNKYIYQVGNEYYTVEADSLMDAMIQVAGIKGAVVLGDYTAYAHMFGE